MRLVSPFFSTHPLSPPVSNTPEGRIESKGVVGCATWHTVFHQVEARTLVDRVTHTGKTRFCMKRLTLLILVVLLTLSVGFAGVWAGECRHKAGSTAPTAAFADTEIYIKVSPHVIVLESDGTWITVHTNIPYGQVETSSVALNGLPADRTKSDLKGYLVAKFDQAAVKAIVAPPEAMLELTGLKTDGEAFSGSEVVEVR